jgi:hypothetical protein
VTDTERAIQLHLDAHPEDHQARGVLADHLDEIGDERGPGYRAMSVLRLYPWYFRGSETWGWFEEGWYGNSRNCSNTDHACLPHDWCGFDTEGQKSIPGGLLDVVKGIVLRRTTDNECARAFVRLPLARQLELLATAVV